MRTQYGLPVLVPDTAGGRSTLATAAPDEFRQGLANLMRFFGLMRRLGNLSRIPLAGVFIGLLVAVLAYSDACATPGELDASFNGNGVVTVENIPYEFAIQPDGKVVWAGEHTLGRRNLDGSPDMTFGNGGTVTISGLSEWALVGAVRLQSDGKIVALVNDYEHYKFTLARYNADGSLDQGFGNAGVTVPRANTMDALAILPDGKIVTGGNASAMGGLVFALHRFNPNGSIDTAFGTDGATIYRVASDFEHILSIAIQPDGKIVAAGWSLLSEFAVARFLANGSIDASFGTGGAVTTHLGEGYGYPNSVALQPDGKIVAGGYGTQYVEGVPQAQFGLVRYLPNGTLDPTFGTGGIVMTAVGQIWDSIRSVLIQPDGKIVAVGDSALRLCWDFMGCPEPDHYHVALVRYQPNGQLDPTFGSGGQVSVGSGPDDNAGGISAALQPDGNIVVAGYTTTSKKAYGTLWRFVIQDAALPHIPALTPWGIWLLSILVVGGMFWAKSRRASRA